MTSARATALLLPLGIILAPSCDKTPSFSPAVSQAAGPLTDRVSDGLLLHPTLQEVVDAQARRDAPALRRFLDHTDPLVRARAAFGAASVQSPRLANRLVQLLDDPDPRVRTDAAFALGQLGDTSSAGPLGDALDHEPEVTAQSRIIEALGRVGTHRTLEKLAGLDPSHRVAPAVALAIARMGARDISSPDAVEWVARRLSAGDPALRLHAAYFFGRMPTSGAWSLHAAYVRDALEDYALDEPAAMHLVLGLGRYHGADGRLLLHRLQHATDWRVRSNTAAALAPLSSDPRIRDGLLTALDDENTHVAATAAASLDWSEMLGEEQLDWLESWITANPDRPAVLGAVLSLLASRDRADIVLKTVREFRADDAAALSIVAPAVGFVRTPEAIALLQELVQSKNPHVREAAITAVSDRWARWRGAVDGTEVFYDIMSAVLRTHDDHNLLAAATVIADPAFRDQQPAELLGDAYRRLIHGTGSPAVIADLTRIMGTIDATVTVRTLEAGSEHDHPAVRHVAAETLASMTGSTAPTAGPVAGVSDINWAMLTDLGPSPHVRLETTQGDVIIELAPEQAPRTVQHFVEMVLGRRYDQVSFSRILPNFAVQASAQDGAESNATGIVSEYTRIPFARGVIGMANSGRDTEGTDFFITHSMQPHLDGHYTAFGRVVHGMDVIDRMTLEDSIISATVIEDDVSS